MCDDGTDGRIHHVAAGHATGVNEVRGERVFVDDLVVHGADGRDAVAGAMLVINATPLGLHDDLLPVDVALLEAGASVLDLVYRRSETAFVRASRARGLPALDGLHMLVEQGAAAFRCWFGIDAPRHAMWQALAFGEGAKR